MSNNPVSLVPVPAAADGTTRGPITLNVTASGDTTLVSNSDPNISLVVTNVWLSNNANQKIKAFLREGAGGTNRWGGTLAAQGGGYVSAFHPSWQLPAGTDLVVNLDATGDVDVNIQFWRK